MVRILSTGTAFNIATTTGDAGQLGIVAGFDGYIGGLMSRLHRMVGLAQSDSDGRDLFKGDALRGDRLWGGLFLPLWQLLAFMGCLMRGDSPLGSPCQRMGWPYPHYFSHH